MPRRLLVFLALVCLATSCMNPRVQNNIAAELNNVGNELAAQRQDMAVLQDQLDSLKRVAIHQDSIIKRLMNATGVQP